METLLTAKELAKWLHMKENTIYIKVSKREIPFIRISKRATRFSKAQIEEWLQKRSAKGKGVEKGFYL